MKKVEKVNKKYAISNGQFIYYIFLSVFISILAVFSLNNSITGLAVANNATNGKIALFLLFLFSLIVFFVIILIVYYTKLKKMKII